MSPPRPGDPRAESLLDAFVDTYPCALVPVPVEEIAEEFLGLRVRETAGLGASGVIVPSHRTIHVNADEPAERRRFTLAHEIGHWVIHCRTRPECMEILCRTVEVSGATDPREREANVFAATLLMPEPTVRGLVGDGVRDAATLAGMLGVSVPAMAWRLYNLGLGERPPGEGGA